MSLLLLEIKPSLLAEAFISSEDARAAGRIKVMCTCFAAKWPYLMTWILKALTCAAAFSLSHPEHMLAGCRISALAVCR